MNERPRFMIAAPASGAGKTTVSVALLRAFFDRGLRPAAFKCGPDYIDPLCHSRVLGAGGTNLDLFFAPPDLVRGLFSRASGGADISVVEGAMGHYDGIAMTDQAGGWHLARETSTPAVLVVDPKGGSLSLAAAIKGLVDFRDESMLAGIILNRCTERLHNLLRPILEKETGLETFGFLPPLPEAGIPGRHLGLATPDAIRDIGDKVRILGREAEKHIDIDRIIALARSAPDLGGDLPTVRPVPGSPVRIAVARDAAFCFYYRENLDLLAALGARLEFFSPLEDASLPAGAQALYIGGGYPELHAEKLAANAGMLTSVRSAIAGGMPVLAEGGGFLYLRESLDDDGGTARRMVGALPGGARNAGRPCRFGYVTLRAEQDTFLCPGGSAIRGHEFHYWDGDFPGDAFRAEKAGRDESWRCFVSAGNVVAGFPHLYFLSNPLFAENFVKAAIGSAT